MSPWSSGQDVALSRLSQGFDSPRRYQQNLEEAKALVSSRFFILKLPDKEYSYSRTKLL